MIFTQAATQHIQALVAGNPDIFASHTPSLSAGPKLSQVLLGALQNEFVGRNGVPAYLYAGHVKVLNSIKPEKGRQQIVDFDDDRGLFLA